MSKTFNPLLPYGLDEVGTGGTGGGTVDTYSRVNFGTVDGTVVGVAPMFVNTGQGSLKVYLDGVWQTFATISFDSLWNSQTDFWDSPTMSWDSPS